MLAIWAADMEEESAAAAVSTADVELRNKQAYGRCLELEADRCL